MLWQRPKVRNLGSWGLKSEPEEKKSACNSQRAQPYRHSDMKTGSLGDALARLNDPPGYPHTYRDLTCDNRYCVITKVPTWVKRRQPTWKADLAEDSGGEGMQDSEHFLDKFKKFLGTWNWWQWYNFTELFLETYLKSTIITCHFTIYWQLDPRFWKSFLM